MSVKYLMLFVDNFTNRSLDYPNVHYYDYGTESSETLWDTWHYDYYLSLLPFDQVDIDSTFTNFNNTGYFHNSQFYGPTTVET